MGVQSTDEPGNLFWRRSHFMNELDYILENFKERFSSFEKKRIVLHGVLEAAEQIVSCYGERFHFIGIIPYEEAEERTFFGLPVLNEDQLETEADLLILTEFRVYGDVVFQRVRRKCKAWGIEVYSMYGVNLARAYEELESQEYQNLYGWKKITQGYDVISFALLGTVAEVDEQKGEFSYARPVFRRLCHWLKEQGKTVLFFGRRRIPDERSKQYLVDEGLVTDAAEAEEQYLCRTNRDLNFRTLRGRFPNAKILHIGSDVLNDGIVPRRYGIDTYRMVFFSAAALRPRRTEQPQGINYQYLLEEIFQKGAAAEVISFDLFDTLITRQTLTPEDVFSFPEMQGKEPGSVADFALERRLIVPRRDMAALLARFVDEGKRVFLTSDMYFSEQQLEMILSEQGIRGYETLLVSSAYGEKKEEGLFEELRRQSGVLPKNILHIGDDAYADVKSAEDAGLQSVKICSGLEMAGASGWSTAIESASSPEERCLVGKSIAAVFNSPFAGNDLRTLPRRERLRRFAYGAAGPMIAGYLTYLIRRIDEILPKKILFIARDGWIVKKLYDRIRQTRPELPEGEYFYCNRRTAFLCMADDLQSIPLITGMGRTLSREEVLTHYYGLAKEQLRHFPDDMGKEEYILAHKDLIQKAAAVARERLYRYLDSIAFEAEQPYILCDFVGRGSAQRFLEKVLKRKFCGVYFGCPDYCEDTGEIDYYCKGDNPFFNTNYMEMETFMTSPEPSLDSYDAQGKPVFAAEYRTDAELQEIRMMHKWIETYVTEFFALSYHGDVIRPKVCEELYAADGYHHVYERAYDDWGKFELDRRK